MKYDDKYWDARLSETVPLRYKRAIKRIYEAYPKECLPQGTSDPEYIINIFRKELGDD